MPTKRQEGCLGSAPPASWSAALVLGPGSLEGDTRRGHLAPRAACASALRQTRSLSLDRPGRSRSPDPVALGRSRSPPDSDESPRSERAVYAESSEFLRNSERRAALGSRLGSRSLGAPHAGAPRTPPPPDKQGPTVRPQSPRAQVRAGVRVARGTGRVAVGAAWGTGRGGQRA